MIVPDNSIGLLLDAWLKHDKSGSEIYLSNSHHILVLLQIPLPFLVDPWTALKLPK